MRTLTLITTSLLIGCTETSHDEDALQMAELIPQEDTLRINLPEASSSPTAKSSGDWATYYVMTRQVTEHVNGLIGWTLGITHHVTTNYPPTWSDEDEGQAIWGPWSNSGLDPVETGVWVRLEDDGSHTWAIFQVPTGGSIEDDSVPVIMGIVDPGSTVDAGTGVFAIDFTTAAELDPAVDAQGTFYVEYAHDETGVDAVAAFEDYGEAGEQRIHALYAYSKDSAGGGEMDLAWLQDIDDSGTDEVLAVKTRWEATGEGRSDAVATEGDLGLTVTASECWGSDFQTSFWTDSIGFGEATGEETDCVFSEAEYASEASFSFSD